MCSFNLKIITLVWVLRNLFNERLKSLLSQIKQGVPTRILRLFHNQKCQQLQDQEFLVLCNFYYICFPISEQIFFSNKCEVSVKVVHCVSIAATRFHSFRLTFSLSYFLPTISKHRNRCSAGIYFHPVSHYSLKELRDH